MSTYTRMTEEQSDLHGEILMKNIFTLTMMGFAGFLFACYTVLA